MIARTLISAAVLAVAIAGGGNAAQLDAPSGPVVLNVSGDITHSNADAVARFDSDMLRALDWVDVASYTDWTEGQIVFGGPTLQSLLDAVGVTSGIIHAVALDEYTVDIPVSDALEFGVILAMERDGKPMRVRDKGPVWVIYPKPTAEDVKDSTNNAKMIWQVKELIIEQ